MKKFRGIYAILTTPFHEDLSLDRDGLERMVDYCVAAGSHGIVIPVNASEYTSLADWERKLVVEWTVNKCAGRIPVIAGVAGVSIPVAVDFARHARVSGADGVIAMPPYINKASRSEIMEYYHRIAEAAELPVFIQNYIGPVGTPLSAEECVQIVSEVENVRYIKEETAFSGHVMSKIGELAKDLPKDKYLGTMGGKAGRYLLDEYRRGCCGNMPACEVVDVQVKIWNALEAGDEKTAVALFNRVLPLLNFEAMYGSALYKVMLKKRGIIDCARVRQMGGRNLDELDMREFERIYEEIKPIFTV